MSTRSGKRIHSSIEEHVVESMPHLKSERNTRSKQQKTDHDLPLPNKKRKHYVRYPSEEEITSTDNENIEVTNKSTRKSRRHTLKEQNKLVTDSEPTIDVKAERSTRRTKKTSVINDLDSVELTLIKEVTEEKKKGKKKKSAKSSTIEENIENVPEADVKITKKKTNKKKNKKKSNSLIVTDVSEHVNKNEKLNKNNTSNDSFHSAAGSPVVNTSLKSANNNNSVSNESPKIKRNKLNILDEESNMNISVDTPNKKRKLTAEMCKQFNGLVTNISKEELLSESDKSRSSVINEVESINNKTFEKDNSLSNKSHEVSYKKNSTKKASFDKTNNVNTTFEVDNNNKHNSSINKLSLSTKRSSLNNTFDRSLKNDTSKNSIIIGNGLGLNATFDMENCSRSDAPKTNDGINDITYSGSKKKRKSSIKNSTYDKIVETPVILNATFDKELTKNSSLTNSLSRDSKSSIDSFDQNKTESLNSTYDKNSKAKTSISCLNATFDKPTSLDSTFDKSLKKDSIDQSKMRPKAKSSLLSSDATDNSSLNITDDNSHVSINSDDSKLENIVNTTPVLVESSMDDSKTDSSEGLTDSDIIKNTTRREETFTEEAKTSASHKEDMFAEIKTDSPLKKNIMFSDGTLPKQANLSDSECTPLNTTTTPKKKIGTETKLATTPLKREGTFTKDSPDVMPHRLSKETTPRRKSLPSPGYTPYPGSKSSLKEKSVLNVTRSIEKSRRSSIAEAAPRMTRVMFCSPVNNPAVVTQMKGKIIKSNLKGSNKSFVFDDSVSEQSRPARKRSYTQSEAEAEPERSTPGRARTASAAGRLQEAPPRRTRLPNFAALHRKQFERMESLDDWQRRRDKRARLLSTPPALVPSPATSAPLASPATLGAPVAQNNASQPVTSTKKIETPKTKQPSAVPGFTKFGFKLNLDVNPFSFPSKNTEVKPKEKKAVILKRQATLPSLAGATALRREIAKQTIMREKSFAEKKNVHRNETRTVIKGVRTNRRFELQMKMRNINN